MIRRQDMSQWHGHTRWCADLDAAMLHAEHEIERTPKVSIWPIFTKTGQANGWVVIAFTDATAN